MSSSSSEVPASSIPLDVSYLAVGDILRSGRGEGILRMEDAGTSEEDDDIDSQDSNTLIDQRSSSPELFNNDQTYTWRCVIYLFIYPIGYGPGFSSPLPGLKRKVGSTLVISW